MSGRAPLPDRRWEYPERDSRDSRGSASGSRPRGDYRGREDAAGRRRTPSPSREDRSYGAGHSSSRSKYEDDSRDGRPVPAAKGNYTGRSSAARDSHSRDDDYRSQNYSRVDDRRGYSDHTSRSDRLRDSDRDREYDRDRGRFHERERSVGDRFSGRASQSSKSEQARKDERGTSATTRDTGERRYWDSNANSNITPVRSKGKEPQSPPRFNDDDRGYDRQEGQSKKPRLDDTTSASRVVENSSKSKGVYVRPEDRQAPKAEERPKPSLPPKPRGLASLPSKPVAPAPLQTKSKPTKRQRSREPSPKQGRVPSPRPNPPSSRPHSPYRNEYGRRPRSPSPASTVRSGFTSARETSFRQDSYIDRDRREAYSGPAQYDRRSPEPRMYESYGPGDRRQRSTSTGPYIAPRGSSPNGRDVYGTEQPLPPDERRSALGQPQPGWAEPPGPSWTDPPADNDPWQTYQPVAQSAPTPPPPNLQSQSQWQPAAQTPLPFSDAPGYNPGYQPVQEPSPAYNPMHNGNSVLDHPQDPRQPYGNDFGPTAHPPYQPQDQEYNPYHNQISNDPSSNLHDRPFMPSGIPLPPIGLAQSDTNRQLSLGIRAPPPGPNKGAGGRFKPITGFTAIGGQAESLKKFFPDAQPVANGLAATAESAKMDVDDSPKAPPVSPQNKYAKAGLPLPPHLAYVQASGSSLQAAPAIGDQSAGSNALSSTHSPIFPGLPSNPASLPTSPALSTASTPSVTLPARPNFKVPAALPPFLPPKPSFGGSDSKTQSKQKGSKKGKESSADKEAPPSLAPPVQLSGPASLPPKPGAWSSAAATEDGPERVQELQRSENVSQSASPAAVTTEPTVSVPVEDQSSKPPKTPIQDNPAPVTLEATPVAPTQAGRELYERIAQVGEGTYGKVYKARNTATGTLVAMKRIRMESEKDGFPVTAVREIKLLQSLDHENVVALHEMMVSKGYVYMVFEYVDHDLTGILHHPSISFSPANLKSLMHQLLVGLDYIHWRGVLHRDLKGSNILLSKHGDLKIADFGLAKFYAKNQDKDYTNRVITQWYKPPELLFGETVYGPDVDMWSSGCIFLELFTKRPVFQGQDEIDQLDVIYKYLGTPSPRTWPTLENLPWYELVKPKKELPSSFRAVFGPQYIKTPAGLDLAEALLTFDPAKRPTARAALEYPYFTEEEPKAEKPTWLADVQGDWHEMESKEASRKKNKEMRKAQQQQQQAVKDGHAKQSSRKT